MKPNAIKDLGSKQAERAENANVLTLRQDQGSPSTGSGTTWGDLLPSRKATLLAKAG
ncbi:MAG: hypothetical protein Q8L87_05690 [Anaerolineales bacterium]|nr:hypothetical protein [Anaerolineales bacterium]